MPREMMMPLTGADREPRLIDIRSIRALPQSTEAWQLGVRDTPHSCDPARLYRLLVLVSPGANVIRQMLPMSRQFGEEGEIVSALESGMLQPRGDLVPARPPAIWVEDERVAECIALPMESCGVRVLVKPALPAVDPVIEALAMRSNIFSDAPLFGTSVLERELASAAAALVRAEPWRYFSGELPLYLHSSDSQVGDSVVVVLGQLREVEGLASYTDEGAYMLTACPPADAREVAGAVTSVIFDRASEVPREARLAFARRQLPIAHGLYPRVLHFALGGRPDALQDELEARRLLRDLQAIVELMERYADSIADGQFSGCTLQVAGHSVEIAPRPDLLAAAAASHHGAGDGPDLSDDRRLPELLGGEHALLVGDVPRDLLRDRVPQERLEGLLPGDGPDTVRALIVRAVKRVAARASQDMRAADELGFGCYDNPEGREQEVVLGYAAGEPIFMIASVAASDDRPLLREMVASDQTDSAVMLVFLAGGARRSLRSLRASAIVGVHVLPQRLLPLS